MLVEPHVSDLIQNEQVGLIMDVTGDPSMNAMIQAMKRPDAEVLSGAATRLLWKLVQHQSTLEAELFRADKLAGLGSFAARHRTRHQQPLQLILGLAENLVDEQDLAVVHEQARDITEAVKRTSAICRDLTRYARRNGAVEDVMVNLNTKLDEALRIARYAVTLQDVTVVKHYDDEATVKGNPDELLHVFVNLITNGVQAIQVRGTLTLETKVGPDGTVSVSVSDTGCGIPKEAFSKILNRSTPQNPGKRDTGLGLYNVMSVISKMDGHILSTATSVWARRSGSNFHRCNRQHHGHACNEHPTPRIQPAGMGLKRKLIVSMLLVGVVPLLLGLGMAFLRGSKEIQVVSGESFQALATEAARKLDLLVAEVTRTSRIGCIRESSNSWSTTAIDCSPETLCLAGPAPANARWAARDPVAVKAVTEIPRRSCYGDFMRLTKESDLLLPQVVRAATKKLFITDVQGNLFSPRSPASPALPMRILRGGKVPTTRAQASSISRICASMSRPRPTVFSISLPIMDSLRYEVVGFSIGSSMPKNSSLPRHIPSGSARPAT